ncbi:porin [Aeromonas simiae]|uniref:porin n=1 Tax=Aeromonas simiae TaxID=218936 RepID=UPI0038CFCAAB
MKKTILAIAIPALFASAANAAVIYDKDGTTFDVYGRVHAQYYGEYDSYDANTDTSTKNDGELKTYARLGWSGRMALDSIWSGIAKTEWQIASENSYEAEKREVKARHIYAGFDGSQYGQFLFGQTETAFYNATVAKTDIFEDYGDMANVYDGRQEGQAIYKGQWGGFGFQTGYITNNSSYDSNYTGWSAVKGHMDKGYTVGATYDFDFGLGLAAGYESKSFEDGDKSILRITTEVDTFAQTNLTDKDDWALAASYTYAGFYFAGLYNESKFKFDGFNDVKVRGYELAASYNVDAWTLMAGYNRSEAKIKNVSSYEDTTNHGVLGVQYAFNTKLKAYTEYKIQGLDHQDDEWTAGMQYNF